MKPIEVDMPPALYTSLNGTRFGIAGSVWIEVPQDTTFEERSNYMINKPRKAVAPANDQEWTVEGSRGNTYTVKLSNGSYSCNCAGYGFRRKCRHIDGVRA